METASRTCLCMWQTKPMSSLTTMGSSGQHGQTNRSLCRRCWMNEPLETIHVYIVQEDEAEEQEQPMVESTINAASHTPFETDTQPLVTKPYPTHLRLVPYLIMAAHLLIVLTAFSIQLYTVLTET